MRRYRILTWQVHGNYLYYLTHAPHEFFVLSKPGCPPGYGGRNGALPWGGNVHDCPVSQVRGLSFDCVLYQSLAHYRNDGPELLTQAQQRLPAIYLEHDPPLSHPADTVHPVTDPRMLIVHVTHYNALMWDCGRVPTCVVEHGVRVPAGARCTGELARGVCSINHLERRGRRLGADVFAQWRERVPIDLFGMDSERSGGSGELPYAELMSAMGRYRFYAHPVRYTSLALAVCEAMTLGLPVIGLGTTELARVVEESGGGYVDTRVDELVGASRRLLHDPAEAQALGRAARAYARERFGIERFAADWTAVFERAIG
jgi:hypothetical protein